MTEQIEKQVERLAELKVKRNANPSMWRPKTARSLWLTSHVSQTNTTAWKTPPLHSRTSSCSPMACRMQVLLSRGTLSPRRLKQRAEQPVNSHRECESLHRLAREVDNVPSVAPLGPSVEQV